MPNPKTAEEWESYCYETWLEGHNNPLGPTSHGDQGLCLDCARAYARQVGEAVREQSAVVLDEWKAAYPVSLWPPLSDEEAEGTILDRTGAAMGRHMGKEGAKQIRALPVETP